MTSELTFPGLRVLLHQPRVVAEGVGFCWYPDLLQFSTGEIMLTHSLNPDSNESLTTGQAVLISRDGGRSWGRGFDVNGFHNAGGEVRITLSDGGIAGPATFPWRPTSAGQWRSFAGHYWRYDNGGRRYSVEPWGARIEGLPRDVAPAPVWSRWSWASLSPFGSALELGNGRFMTTCYMTYQGDRRSTTEAMVSEDQGRTWHYQSTIGGPDAVPDATEGPGEPCLVEVENGEIMCVARVGGLQPLARCYSSDRGQTWSAMDRLPVGNVAPSMIRLSNGVIAISAGRPGITLALSADPRGEAWQCIDLIAHHNASLDPSHRIAPCRPIPENPSEADYLSAHFDLAAPFQTTGYVSLLQIEPNRVLLAYDRIPHGWSPVPTDAEIRSRILSRYPTVSLPHDSIVPRERERVYLLEIEVQRD